MQALDQDAVKYLQAKGLKVTSGNLNRAMSFLADNANLRDGGESDGIKWNTSPIEEQFARELELQGEMDQEGSQSDPEEDASPGEEPESEHGAPLEKLKEAENQKAVNKPRSGLEFNRDGQGGLGERFMQFVGDNPQIGSALMQGGAMLVGGGMLPGLVRGSGLVGQGLGMLEQQLLRKALIRQAAQGAGLM